MMTDLAELTFEYLDLAESGIQVHPLLKHIPAWDDNSENFVALCIGIELNGVSEPIKITSRYEILDADSRERWRAAKKRQLERIPVIIVPDAQVASICLNSLLHRRHLSKSALAYLAFPIIAQAWDECRKRRLENLRNFNTSRKCTPCTIGQKVEDFAEQIGISRRLFFHAQKVHELFAKDADYKALMEPRILADCMGSDSAESGPVGLGAVVAGHSGRKNLGQERIDKKPATLFKEAFKILTNRFTYWKKFTSDQREELVPVIRKTVAEMPSDLRHEWEKALKDVQDETPAKEKSK